MSPIRSSLLLGAGDAAPTGAQVSRSLRFNSADSAYLSKLTWGTSTNAKKGTFSLWVKRSGLGSTRYLVYAYDGSAGNSFGIYFVSDDTIRFQFGGSSAQDIVTSAVFRDPSAWYHLVLVWDTTDGTPANRTKIYVNNVQQALSTANYPTQNANAQFPSTVDNFIGFTNTATFSGYLANIHFIDGQALTPASFAETDATTGQWIPKAYSGSYGTNGFYLQFADNSSNTASTLGKDYSGLGNNWTPNNLSVTAGAGNDSLVDSPTNYGTDTGVGGEVRGNYCTWNAVNKSVYTTLSNGNLNTTSAVGSWRAVFGTVGMSSGKWYWELTVIGVGPQPPIYGIAKQGANLESYIGSDANGWGYYGNSGTYNNSNYINSGSFASYTTGDVIGVAFDADNGSLYFYKNGTVQNSGSAAYTGLTSGPYFPAVSHFNITNSDANFGQRAFAYQTPGTNRPAATFLALCTQNLPAPLVTKSNTVMDVLTWTGTGGSRTLTGLGFSPDFVWGKARSAAGYNHQLYDVIRGTGSTKDLSSSLTAAEGSATTDAASYGYLSSFTSDGFDTTSGSVNNAYWNGSGTTYVAWSWDAGTSTVTNNSGSISSQVRANATAGFSVVTYTGLGAGSYTVGHGLGVAPSLIICKTRASATQWVVYHASLGANAFLGLNTTDASISSTGYWGSGVTSTVFGLQTDYAGGNNNGSIVAYCFAPVVALSSFGSYTGNGSTDGPFVYTGFRPRFILTKATNSTFDWNIFDAARAPYNSVNKILYPNLSNAESDYIAYTPFDFLSNGFKLRTSVIWNASSTTYIYAAFAESPFQYARAR
jgi:hypothetical protein